MRERKVEQMLQRGKQLHELRVAASLGLLAQRGELRPLLPGLRVGADERHAALAQALHHALHQLRPRADGRAIFVLIAEHLRVVALREVAHAGANAHALRPGREHALEQRLDLVGREGLKGQAPRRALALLRAKLRVIEVADAVGAPAQRLAHLLKDAAQRLARLLGLFDALAQRLDLLRLPSAVRAANGAGCARRAGSFQGHFHDVCPSCFDGFSSHARGEAGSPPRGRDAFA